MALYLSSLYHNILHKGLERQKSAIVGKTQQLTSNILRPK